MPGLVGALSIRVSDGVTDRIVTRYCHGLKFTKVAPGGHQSLSFTMVLPRNTFSNLGPADRVYVYDTSTSRTIMEGYIENPVPVDGPDGQQYDVVAVGGMALASDETRALIYVDKGLDGWVKVQYGAAGPSANAEQWSDGAGTLGMRVQFVPSQPVATSSVAAVENRVLQQAGMSVAGLRVVTGSGKIDTNYRTDLYDLVNGITSSTGSTTQIQQVGVDQTFWVPTNFGTTGAFLLQLRRSGAATNVADDTTWSNFVSLSILGRRYDRNGNLLATAAAHDNTADSVLAYRVVEDMLGRLLTFCDAASAQVDVTTFAITQLAWPDGVKAADVLTQLSLWESGYLWEILESNSAGKHRFNYRAWPTTSRYEVSVRDGWQQRGSDVDLCNRILVHWTDANGSTQATPVTAASLGLIGLGLPVDDLGTRVKDADPITLPDGFGSAANATRIGGQILTDKINPPKAGVAIVRRPILDLLTGNLVMPWEIVPGYLCRIRETGDDMRITEVEYDDDSCSMQLTLGTPVLTDDQRLARLDRAA